MKILLRNKNMYLSTIHTVFHTIVVLYCRAFICFVYTSFCIVIYPHIQRFPFINSDITIHPRSLPCHRHSQICQYLLVLFGALPAKITASRKILARSHPGSQKKPVKGMRRNAILKRLWILGSLS